MSAVLKDPLPQTAQDLLAYLAAHTAYIEIHHAEKKTGVVDYAKGAWRAYRSSGPGYGCDKELGDTERDKETGEDVYLGFCTLDQALHAYAEDALMRGNK